MPNPKGRLDAAKLRDKKVRKSGIFILGLLLYPNVGLFTTSAHAAQADPLLDMCLEYMSCMASMSYYELIPETAKAQAKQICDDISRHFVELVGQIGAGYESTFANLGWDLGEAHRMDLQYGVPEYDSALSVAVTAYGECARHAYVTVTPTATEYYDFGINKDELSRRLYIVGPLATCPDGGLGYSNGAYGIESCHVDTFSDVTGSGEYQGGCFYTR